MDSVKADHSGFICPGFRDICFWYSQHFGGNYIRGGNVAVMCLWRNSASFHWNHVWLMKLFKTVDIALSGLSRKQKSLVV